MKNKSLKRTISAGVGIAILGASGMAAAGDVVVLMVKPYPFSTNSSQEAGGSADLAGDFSLMGAKMLGDQLQDSGGAYLFENGNYAPRQLLRLQYGATIKVERFYYSYSGGVVVPVSETECSFTQNMIKGSFLGERVALSKKWAALASYDMGRGLAPPHEVANCDGQPGAVPAIFLSKRNASGEPRPFGPLNYAFSTPFRERVQSMDVSETDLVVMGAGHGVYVYSYNQSADEWEYNTSLDANHDFGEHFGQTVAIDGNYIVVGDRDHQQIFVYRKQGSTWSRIHQYQSTDNPSFGRAVDISGGNIIVAGDEGADIFEFDASSLTFLSRGRDQNDPRAIKYVAISGDHATAVEEGNTQTLAHYARNIAEGGFYSSGRIPLVVSDYVGDNLNMDGVRVLSGSKSWTPGGSFSNVGAMLWTQAEYLFQEEVTVDDAEGERLWHNAGEFNWERHHGPTQSSGTGPSGGAGGSQHYYFVETSQGGAFGSGKEARLESDYVPTAGGLEFDYHLQGVDAGKLYIEAWDANGTGWQLLDLIDGTQAYNRSSSWRRFYVSLDTLSSVARLRFRYVTVGGWQGDVALDNITVAKH